MALDFPPVEEESMSPQGCSILVGMAAGLVRSVFRARWLVSVGWRT